MIFSFIVGYLDPGTGSMLVQFIIAAVSGVVFFFGSIKRTIVSWFSKAENKGEVTKIDESDK